MKRATVQEFQANPEEYVRLAEGGESIELTDGERPLAMITPIKKDETTVERLVREGQPIPVKRSGPLPPPSPPLPDSPTLSEVLQEMREDER